MNRRTTSTIVVGIATFIAVLGVALLLNVGSTAAIIIAAICALVAQWVTGWQTRR